jgi:hypothetical protein
VITALVGKVVSGNWLSKHGLLTAFFPNLALWTLILGLLFRRVVGEKLPEGVGATEIAAWSFLFLVWVMAWTFLTINVQPQILKFMRGDSDPDGLFGPLMALRRRHWRNRIRVRGAMDRAAEEEQVALDELEDRVKALVERLPPAADDGFLPSHRAAVLDQLHHLGSAAARPEAASVARARELLQGDLAAFERAASVLSGKSPAEVGVKPSVAASKEASREGSSVPDLAKRMYVAAEDLRIRLSQQRDVIQADRDWHHESTKLVLPTDPNNAGPTRLGNVFRTTEEVLNARYGIRPWLLTPHLRMALPAGYAESLVDDSRLALDLSATLSAMLAIFGTFVAALFAWNWPEIQVFTMKFTFGPTAQAIAFVGGVSILAAVLSKIVWLVFDLTGRQARYWRVATFALAAALLTIPAFWAPLAPMANGIGRVAILALLLGGILIGSHIAYLNAVAAAMVYCENMKTLFDGHRSRILTALRLRIPTTIDDERQLWRQLCQQLDRAYTGSLDPRFVSFTSETATALPVVRDASPARKVLGAARPLDVFTRLTAADLKQVTVWGQNGHHANPDDVAKLVGKQLLSPVGTDEPIALHQVAAPRATEGRVLLAVPMASRVLLPHLRTGDRVSLIFVTAEKKATAVIDDLIVSTVTIRKSEKAEAAGENLTSASDALVTVFVPADRIEALGRHIAAGALPAMAMVPLKAETRR